MQENGGKPTKTNTSFRMEEPPPDPEDFGTKEEELKNRELLSHLYEQQKKRREIVYRLELEEKIKKELEEENRLKDLYAKKSYFERRNASAKYRSMANNERIKQMLSKVDEYMKKISNLDSIERIKEQAQKELEEEIERDKKKKRKLTKKEIDRISKMNKKEERLRKENKKFMEQRVLNEKLKKEKLEKAQKANERAEKILKNGYKLPKAGDANNDDKNINLRSGGLGIFLEEKIEGTNLAPNDINNNKNKIQRPNSSIKLSNRNNLNKVNINEEMINPEEKLKEILKKNPNNLKELLKFQKKYKYIDITPHIHKAQMNQIKLNKNKQKHKHNQKILNINDNIEQDDSLENNEDDKIEGNKILFQEEEIQEGDNAPNINNELDIDNNNEEEDKKEEDNNDNNNGMEQKKKKKKKSKSKEKKKKVKKKNINNLIKNNYLEACKYNNDECIKNILLNAENDEKVCQIVNERDKYNRNGLMYLLIHNNTNMIKLSLLSGVKLDESKDIYGRNLIHYCCTNNVNKSILDIICHCIEFK